MFTPPHIGRQLAKERHRELLAEAKRQRLAQQVRAEAKTAGRRAPLVQRPWRLIQLLWRRIRPVSRSGPEPQACPEPQTRPEPQANPVPQTHPVPQARAERRALPVPQARTEPLEPPGPQEVPPQRAGDSQPPARADSRGAGQRPPRLS